MVELDASTEKVEGVASDRRAGFSDKRLQVFAILLVIVGCVALAASPLVMMADRAVSAAIRGGPMPGDLRKAIELSEAFAHGSGVAVILISLLLVSSRPRKAIWTV